jgi:putative SOS response-associated peptidase YedK
VSVGTNRKSIIELAAASHTPALPESLELPFFYVAFAFDFPLLPVLRNNGEWQLARWGLVPFWTKTLEQATKIRRQTVNARSESMWQKPAFKEAVTQDRCLIPVDGFFEFHHHAGKAYPFYIYLEGSAAFFLAGLRQTWRNPESPAPETTCSIVTTSANTFMAEIHNKLPQPSERRMPVIVPAEQIHSWLSPATPVETLRAIVSSRPIPQLKAHAVNRSLNSAATRINDAAALDPVSYPELAEMFARLSLTERHA